MYYLELCSTLGSFAGFSPAKEGKTPVPGLCCPCPAAFSPGDDTKSPSVGSPRMGSEHLQLSLLWNVWAHAASRQVPRNVGMKSGFGKWELNDFPAGSHAGFFVGPGIQPRSPGSLPTPWAARPVLSSVSRDPREHWHLSKSAGNFPLFCLGWFTFFHLIPTLKISSFLFFPKLVPARHIEYECVDILNM